MTMLNNSHRRLSGTRALYMAHIYKKNAPMISWADCMRYAWMLVRFRQMLQNGFVTFSFIKKDGTHRIATGTLYPHLIPVDKHPGTSSRQTGGVASAEKGQKPNYGIINYFDLDKQDWRSFRIDEFTGRYDVFQITQTEHREID